MTHQSDTSYFGTLIVLAIIGGPAAVIGGVFGMALPGLTMFLGGLLLLIVFAFVVTIALDRWKQRPARLRRLADRQQREIERFRAKLPVYR